MGYIRDVAIGGETHLIEPILYGISSTAAATAAKTTTINNFELVEGVVVKILFQNENSAATPTLNISNTGAKTIKLKGNWDADDIITFTYDGTNWVMENNRGIEVIRL